MLGRCCSAVGSAGQGRVVSAGAADWTGSASRCSRWRSGWGWIISGCSSSSRPRPGTTRRCGANVARWAVEVIGPDAWVIDDTGFPEGRHGVAVCGPAVLRHAGQGRQLPDRGQRARWSPTPRRWPLDWRLFCPSRWDDTTDRRPGRRRGGRGRRRARARIPDDERHRREVAAGAGHARRDDRRVGTADAAGAPPTPATATPPRSGSAWHERGIAYVGRRSRPTTTAHPADAVPGHRRPTPGRGRPPVPALPATRQPRARPGPRRRPRPRAARSPGATAPARHQDNPTAAMRSHFLRHPDPPGQPRHPPRRRRHPARAWLIAEWPPDDRRTHQLLAVQPARPTPRSTTWSAWPRSAGGSNTTTANSKPASAWTTSKAAPSPAGTATSPSPPLAQPSAPCCAYDPKAAAPA